MSYDREVSFAPLAIDSTPAAEPAIDVDADAEQQRLQADFAWRPTPGA